MDIFIKTLKSIFDKNYWLTVLVGILADVARLRIAEGDFSFMTIVYGVFVVLTFVVISFWVFFAKNYVSKKWLEGRIEISKVPRDESYDDKLLLRIDNKNYGNNLTDVKVELLKIIPSDNKGVLMQNEDESYCRWGDVDIKGNVFEEGLSETGFVVKERDYARVEIVKHSLVSDDDDNSIVILDFLLPAQLTRELPITKYSSFGGYLGIKIRISGKIAGFSFSRVFVWKFKHIYNGTTVFVSNNNRVEKLNSKLEWVTLPNPALS